MKYLKSLSILLVMLAFIACKNNSSVRLESGFETPPADIRVGCYWYWIDKTVTKEGIIADLEAMKKAGITRAYIGLTGGGEELAFMSDQWWNMIHTTLKKATELDIEIGMFNCPGWSQSGGPWIDAHQSMRYLAGIQRRIIGPTHFSEKIEVTREEMQKNRRGEFYDSITNTKPEDFEDVRVLTFPINKEATKNLLDEHGAKITPSTNISKTENGLQLPRNEESTITLKLAKAVPVQSLVISSYKEFRALTELQYRDGSEYRTIKSFNFDRSDHQLSRGFHTWAPLAITFPEITADEFRLVFTKTGKSGFLTGFSLTHAPVLERYEEKTFGKMFNSLAPPWNAFMWDAETADSSLSIPVDKIIDISDKLAADGTLTWDVPEGDWVIIRMGMYPTGIANSPSPVGALGYECDKMSAEHTAYHHDKYIGEIIKRIPAEDRKTFKVNVLDSYEKGGQNITDDFIEIFKKRYNYDPTPYFPAYYGYPVGSPELSDRFLWDMRRLVADRIAMEYVRTLREKSNADGLTTWLENYGSWGFAGEFLQYGGQSDEVGGEFWVDDFIGKEENRCASSCAHIYGKTKVWSESFTNASDHYRVSPATLKKRGDWAIAEGVNAFVLHVNIQQQADDTYPGVDAWYNCQFNRKNTWFSQLDLFSTYLRRCSFMLQQGIDVSDVAYFIGEDAPKMCGITQPETPAGYHYDHINAEVLMNNAIVKDGKLTLPHGTQYRILVLPPQEKMRPEMLSCIAKLVEQGLTVVGNPPLCSPSLENYPESDGEVKALATQLWGGRNDAGTVSTYGKGKIYPQITSLQEIFESFSLAPDFAVEGDAPIMYTHRRDGNTDIYFLSNQSDTVQEFNATFRVKSKQPEFWDPMLGSHRPLPAFSQNSELTTVPLKLEPAGSAFIVFRNPASSAGALRTTSLQENFPVLETVLEISSPWTVSFQSDTIYRGPSEPVVFETLTDWAKSENEAIKFYSGTAIYRTTIKIKNVVKSPEDYKKLFLDFEKVGVMAKVKLNGQYAGGVWAEPYLVDITKFIKEGDNELEVEVVNNWANRIIGDRNLPEEERRLKINRGPKATAPLMESGIIGTVKILKFQK
ncbi:MAG: glycoside hydrolase family 2 [Dysgonamonadaceae bacterium]|jgi:hypothetical protein|nr:glycoside hydrolase family 2 [Dysgonamonadaceae bacterium]